MGVLTWSIDKNFTLFPLSAESIDKIFSSVLKKEASLKIYATHFRYKNLSKVHSPITIKLL
jgi:hypothetical protein